MTADVIRFPVPYAERLMIDPPDGWRYGFPKAIPKKDRRRVKLWLVENGYPKSRIAKDYVHCRYWYERPNDPSK